MDVDYIHHDNCRLCNSSDVTKVLSLTPTPPANAFVGKEELDKQQQTFPLDLYFCQSCAHVQLLDVVSPEILFQHYVYVSGTSPVFVRHFEDYANAVSEQAGLRNDELVIDIGSNDGTLLGFFQKQGCKVLGIDPAIEIAEQATADGINTINGFFGMQLAEEIRQQHGKARVITANNVFAHIDDIQGVVDGIKALLEEDGIFVFEVSWLLELYRGNLFDMIYHEHLDYHSVIPLLRFFEERDMQLFRVQKVNTHGGSIRCYVRMAGNGIKAHDSVDGIVEQEKQAGLDRAETFLGFSRHIEQVGSELMQLLTKLKSEKKSIAGFGAPAKATTLMYHFGITPDIIDYIVDDSPLKQGLYSPGLHIPVVSSECLYQELPDYLLILAWNFAEPIMKNHARFHNEGGKFIVPLPKVEII